MFAVACRNTVFKIGAQLLAFIEIVLRIALVLIPNSVHRVAEALPGFRML